MDRPHHCERCKVPRTLRGRLQYRSALPSETRAASVTHTNDRRTQRSFAPESASTGMNSQTGRVPVVEQESSRTERHGQVATEMS